MLLQARPDWWRSRTKHSVKRTRAAAVKTSNVRENRVINLILLHGDERFSRRTAEEAPELLEQDGLSYSLRAGPRTPLSTIENRHSSIAVYALDEITEEEFQEIYAAVRPLVIEFNLTY